MKVTIPETIKAVQNDQLYIGIRFGKHGRAHAERVLLFANMLAAMVQVNQETTLDIQAVSVAALLHDCARVRDGHDPKHGLNSARAACEMIERMRLECDKDRVYEIIVRHCPPRGYKFETAPSFESMVVGDADKLDRFRFHSLGGPTPRYFMLPEYSIALMDVASRVNGHRWRSFKKGRGFR